MLAKPYNVAKNSLHLSSTPDLPHPPSFPTHLQLHPTALPFTVHSPPPNLPFLEASDDGGWMDSTGLLHKDVNCVSQDAGPMCGSVYLGSHSHSPFFIPLSFLCLTSISLVDQTSRCLSQCHLKFKPRSVTDSFLSLYIFFQTGPKYDLQRLRQWMDDEIYICKKIAYLSVITNQHNTI